VQVRIQVLERLDVRLANEELSFSASFPMPRYEWRKRRPPLKGRQPSILPSCRRWRTCRSCVFCALHKKHSACALPSYRSRTAGPFPSSDMADLEITTPQDAVVSVLCLCTYVRRLACARSTSTCYKSHPRKSIIMIADCHLGLPPAACMIALSSRRNHAALL
jgi:hypothetical protein